MSGLEHAEIILAICALAALTGSIVTLIWKARGWVDDIREDTRIRHRQNTLRMDWMLSLINRMREDDGKPPVTCPYRLVIDP